MRLLRTLATLLLVGASTLSLTGCAYGVIAAGALASRAISKNMNTSPSSDFTFANVTWLRTPADTNTLTVRGTLTWTKSRSGVNNTSYWDISPQSGGQNALTMDLVDPAGRTMASVRGALTVWDGKERITMVPLNKAVSFELRTMQISPNVARAIQSVKMQGHVF
ncbi:MAG: hypothetical protein ACYC1I_12915 [Acidimicrobiales bacterium]